VSLISVEMTASAGRNCADGHSLSLRFSCTLSISGRVASIVLSTSSSLQNPLVAVARSEGSLACLSTSLQGDFHFESRREHAGSLSHASMPRRCQRCPRLGPVGRQDVWSQVTVDRLYFLCVGRQPAWGPGALTPPYHSISQKNRAALRCRAV